MFLREQEKPLSEADKLPKNTQNIRWLGLMAQVQTLLYLTWLP